MDNNQIFRNCFVIIYCHLTQVLSQINKCIIFEPSELSITLSTLWLNARYREAVIQWNIAGRHRSGPLAELKCRARLPSGMK